MLKTIARVRILTAAVLLLFSGITPAAADAKRVNVTASTASLAMFATEAAAQAHCPRDQVVWLNTNSGIYHEKGMRWYGRTRNGAYVCRREADAAGDRDTRNGQ